MTSLIMRRPGYSGTTKEHAECVIAVSAGADPVQCGDTGQSMRMGDTLDSYVDYPTSCNWPDLIS